MSLLWTWIEMGAPEKAPGEGPGTPPEPLEPTYASLYQNVFKPKCVTCHSPGNTGSRIPLTEEGLLNSPLELIIPGNPDESGLVVAVERNDDKRMPPAKEGYSKLKDEEKAAIRAWIEKISPPAVNPSPGNESSSPRTPAPDLVLPTFDSLNDRIFQARCITCHAAGKTAARVPLTKQGLLDSPLELVIPGNPDESGVVVAVERGDDNRMPPPKDGFSSIKENEKQALREWIKNGAKD